MEASYLIILLFALASIARPNFLQWKPRILNIPAIPSIVFICTCLCVIFAVKLHTVNESAHNFYHLPSYVKNLPILAVQSSDHYNNVDGKKADIIESICIAQSIFLFFLACILYKKSDCGYIIAVIISLTASILAALAFSSSSMEGVDLYAYVAQAQAVPSAYHPSPSPFTGENALLNKLWGLPLWPSPYGPLWIALTKITIAHAPTLLGKLLALRLLQIFVIALCATLLALLRMPSWVQAVFIVNPMLYDAYVSEGHNDLVGVAFVLTAALLCRFSPYLALLPAIAAGMIKLPFILIGALAFTNERSPTRRIFLCLTSICSACVVSVLTGGSWYWDALRCIAQAASPPASLPEKLLHIPSAFLALAFLCFSVYRRQFMAGAVWSIATLSVKVLPQYLAWAFPYALLGEEPNFVFFITLPISLYLLNTQYEITPFFIALRIALVIIPVTVIIQALLQHRRFFPERHR